MASWPRAHVSWNQCLSILKSCSRFWVVLKILSLSVVWCFFLPCIPVPIRYRTDYVITGILLKLRLNTNNPHSSYTITYKMTLCSHITAGNRHKQNSWFCKEIREDNFRCWWRRVHKDASQGMYMSKIEIFFFTARILQNQRMLCCGECFHD